MFSLGGFGPGEYLFFGEFDLVSVFSFCDFFMSLASLVPVSIFAVFYETFSELDCLLHS